jgi:hypothetical protein
MREKEREKEKEGEGERERENGRENMDSVRILRSRSLLRK